MINSELQSGNFKYGAKEPLISIIIPSYNREFSLPVAVESVLVQNEDNWELIIVDDGSTDETCKIVQTYLADDRIKYFYQKNQGVSAARNKGVEKATGNFVIFLDSDDHFFQGLLKKLYDVNFFDYDLICWQVLKIIDGKKHIWKAKDLGVMYNSYKATFFSGSICYKKDVFLKAGGYDTNITFGENYELGMRISDIPNLKIILLDQPFLKYEIVTSNRTSNSIKNRLTSAIYQYEKHQSKYELNPRAKSEILYIIGYLLENSGNLSLALKSYRKAWGSYRYNFKAFLKMLYLPYFS